MGKRREPRKEFRVPVRIFGTDRSGQVFSEKVFTVNISRSGAEVSGVQAQPNIDEIVGLTCGEAKGHFRVKWVGEPGTPRAGHLGLLNLAPEKPLWNVPLPTPSSDASWRDARDRRAYPRLKCTNSVEVYPNSQTAPVRARTSDLSLGGCFVEMPNPIEKGTRVRIALWLQETKLWANGRVVTSTPGFGIGVQFTDMSAQDRNLLQQYLRSITRIPI